MFPFEFKFKYSQNKSAKELRLSDYKSRVFTGVQYLTMILVVSSSFFTGVARPDMSWKISQHCEDPKFNQPLTQVDKTWAIGTTVVVSLIIVCLMSTKMLFYGWENKDVLDIVNYFFGILSLWVACYALKSLIGYPIPSFFTKNELYAFYCCKHCLPIPQTKKLTELDLDSRGSFPSFLICALSYSSTFLFVVCTYLDENRRFAAKLLALLLPGGVSFIYSWYLWQSNEHHLQDVVGGALLGCFLGAYIARDIYKRDNTSARFQDDFVTVLMAREIIAQAERANRGGTHTPNEYVINLYPHENEAIGTQNSNNNNAVVAFNDDPPPYSSLNLAE
ncbi:hypothetical protein TcasGA2_TC013645 [Tribolium castaneum]|uniref:Phosphatidic acid phosphatase type 2/haloperoxidase domain-containing protein n=2 Tax=Tribolium castaneum TaxID=7070 RepID=D6WKL2_TRICA|nr:PREDICTED: uncharacterized protein LOC103312975 [Tribolium castaneum]EFA03562.2 hypothetical protein TcasGA2_TC013645 [Tribolium castaneum]|eukprot:XP_008193189.2 PREDICTED: uncharacterized protein LOC103312975 [Tribolium castaneum]